MRFKHSPLLPLLALALLAVFGLFSAPVRADDPFVQDYQLVPPYLKVPVRTCHTKAPLAASATAVLPSAVTQAPATVSTSTASSPTTGLAAAISSVTSQLQAPVAQEVFVLSYRGQNRWVAQEDTTSLRHLVAMAKQKDADTFVVRIPPKERKISTERLMVLQHILEKSLHHGVTLMEENPDCAKTEGAATVPVLPMPSAHTIGVRIEGGH